MDDIYEPLERYKNELKAAFRKNAEEAFAEIEAKATINKQENQKLCATADSLLDKIKKHNKRLSWLLLFRVILVVASIPLLLSFLYYESIFHPAFYTYYIVISEVIGIFLLICVFTTLRKRKRVLHSELVEFKQKHKNVLDLAWKQMESVNTLFSWDIPTKLIEKTVPNIKFDSYFNAARLKQLHEEFGYDDFLNVDSSVLFAHSGEIKGNPFVIATTRNFSMGTKVYTGSKTIYWTVMERGSDGKMHSVTKSETLHASVEKPYPYYGNNTFLLYANDAAPSLSFSRKPEGLANEGFMINSRKRRKRRELEKFSRNLTDNYSYTMMTNQEFEVLFSTKDRDNEVEYRLLFTPIAQQQIIALMKDTEVGYGDDFEVQKRKKINVVYPTHLYDFNIDTNPARFQDYNFELVKERFMKINEEYFRAVYFAFAPLLSIPLYQQIRTRKNIYGVDLLNKSTFWEWESLVNHQGEEKFAHPSCATSNILKTKLLRTIDNSQHDLQVTAHGFSETPRVDYVRVHGGDGRWHTIDVHWYEYNPVSRQSHVSIAEFPDSDKEVIREKDIMSYSTHNFRRKILLKK